MASISSLIDVFYAKEKHKYPGMTKAEFAFICRAPFATVKQDIDAGNMKDICIKYLGKFKPARARIVGSIPSSELAFSKGNMTEERYNEILNNYENYKREFNVE